MSLLKSSPSQTHKHSHTHRHAYIYFCFSDGQSNFIYYTNLNKLQKKVKSKNLLWKIIDEEKAKQSLKLNNKYHKVNIDD